MKRRVIFSVCIGMVALVLGGCASQIPDMTDVQRREISEYAAELLIKYDTSQPGRLVDLELYEEPEATSAPEATPEPEKNGMDEAADTPVVELDDTVVVPQGSSSAQDTLLLPEYVTLEYSGYQVVNTWTDTDEAGLVLDAESGKTFLVFRFMLLNSGSTVQEVDMMQESVKYTVTVDGKILNGMVTLLSNDLTTYFGTLNPDESKEVLLLAEVAESELTDDSHISITFSRETMTTTITVK